VPSITGVNAYTLGIPAATLSGSRGEGALTYFTGAGSLTIPANMLARIPGTEGAEADITSCTGRGNFSPGVKLTRGQFLVLLMKVYNLAPDANPRDNFSDEGSISAISRRRSAWASPMAQATIRSRRKRKLPGRKCSPCCTMR
jgi:hypothetical protein